MSDLEKQLAALRAKLKPALTDEQKAQRERDEALRVQIADARRALREQENDEIKAAHVPNKTRRFFDLDPDCEQPATVEHNGIKCTLYTRFVVCGANADQLERHGDAVVVSFDANGKPTGSVDASKQIAIVNEMAESCIVYPTAAIAGVSDEQHKKNVKASLWYLGAARAEVGKAALELGGVDAALRRSKS